MNEIFGHRNLASEFVVGFRYGQERGEMRTYVIGDIHGCFQEFVELLDLCGAHAAGKPARLITLGDYVDRGPDRFGSFG